MGARINDPFSIHQAGKLLGASTKGIPMESATRAEALLALAMKVVKEGEPIDLSDYDFDQATLAEMRSHLSQMRSAIDMLNKGIAMYWDDKFADWTYDDGAVRWGVSRPKSKRAYDEDKFFDWLAGKDADELKRLVSVSSIKVGGMSEVERATLLNEEPTAKDVRLTSKPL